MELRALVANGLRRLGELPSAELSEVLTGLGQLRRIQLELHAPNGRVGDGNVEEHGSVVATENVANVGIFAHIWVRELRQEDADRGAVQRDLWSQGRGKHSQIFIILMQITEESDKETHVELEALRYKLVQWQNTNTAILLPPADCE